MLGPIFAREWLTVPRRVRQYAQRSLYVGVLWVLGVTAWQATIGWQRTPTLGDTARFGMLLFQLLTYYVQLPMLLFFAAFSGAIAVAQEKDRRTFILLLVTDLRSYEIVLGKLLGNLLTILLLLLAMVPVLASLLLLGGVSVLQIVQATLILAASAVAAGSLGSLVALWRDRTFPALALTFLFLVLYLCLVRALGALPQLLALLGLSGWVEALAGEQWPIVTIWLDPFQALDRVLDAPSDTAYAFAGVMVLLSGLLNAWAIRRLRVWNPSGEPIMQREKMAEDEAKDRVKAHAAPGPARAVWANPILWREVRTRAYGRQPLLVKLAYFLVIGLVAYYAVEPLLAAPGNRPPFAAAYGLVPVAILSLLLLAAQAATAITSERDGHQLDLLLVTDLTPNEFIFGKLAGIAWNVKEYLLPPLALAVVYACAGLLATPPRGHPEMLVERNIAALIAVLGTLLVLITFTAVLAIHVSLRTENSRLAIANTLGTVFFLSVGTLICIYLIVINGRFEYQWFSFIFFIAAGIGGLWWVLSADRPSAALTLASWLCPLAMFYAVTNVLVGRPGSEESTEPFLPFLVVAGSFGFAVTAMLIPLLSEFDVALGRTTGGGE